MMRAPLAAAMFAAASAGTVDIAYTGGWRKMERVRASLPVSFTIVLKEQGADEVVRIAKEVSDPDHKNYGKYLSTAQLNAIVKPTDADYTVRAGRIVPRPRHRGLCRRRARGGVTLARISSRV
eukprot:SAG22_NODE_8683_length_637_cov_0.819703_1_plen_122_part_10